ncbi:zonular occludens toxin domain-containing protein [Sulfurospirillum sp. 1307]
MIDLVTGVPGSGKTYKAVYLIKNLCEKNPKKYKHIFTNINGLNYDKCNEIAKEPDYVKAFEFRDLKQDIILEYSYHEQYKLGEIQIDDYDDFIKSEGVFKKYINSLIVIDECHLFFETKAEDTLIRFLSYHRHFDIDLLLLTQNKNLVDKKYLSFIETMYSALPSSKRLFSFSFFGLNIVKFRYRKYASYQEYHSNIVGTESLPFVKEVYELYNSGGTEIKKSASLKFLMPVIIVSLITFVAYKYVSARFSPPKKPTNQISRDLNSTNSTNKTINTRRIVNDDVSDFTKDFFVADCFTQQCKFLKYDVTFSRDTMLVFINKFKCKILVNEIISNNYSEYILECDKKFNDLLSLFDNKKNGVKDEKAVNRPVINPFNSSDNN